MTTFTRPDLPKILTKKDWDSKKGVVAKMAGKTGVGEECLTVAKLYAAVKWDKLDIEARKRAVLKNWRDDSYTLDNWVKILNGAMSETTGGLAKLSQELFTLRDLCKRTAETFKKSKTIPSSATKHVLEMANAADRLGVQLNKNSMGGVLKAMDKEFREDTKIRFIDPMWPGVRKYANDHATLMADIRRNPTPQKLNDEGRTACRDIQTGLGNIAKLGDRGWGPRQPQAQQLFDQLKVWGDAPSLLVDGDASSAEVLAMLDKIEPVFQRALRFVAAAG